MLIPAIVVCAVFLALGAFIISLCVVAARPAPAPEVNAKIGMHGDGRMRRLKSIRLPHKVERAS